MTLTWAFKSIIFLLRTAGDSNKGDTYISGQLLSLATPWWCLLASKWCKSDARPNQMVLCMATNSLNSPKHDANAPLTLLVSWACSWLASSTCLGPPRISPWWKNPDSWHQTLVTAHWSRSGFDQHTGHQHAHRACTHHKLHQESTHLDYSQQPSLVQQLFH